MYINPWYQERMAEYERDRIRRDIKLIHLEEALQAGRTEDKTTKARLNRSRLLMFIAPRFVKGMFCTGK